MNMKCKVIKPRTGALVKFSLFRLACPSSRIARYLENVIR